MGLAIHFGRDLTEPGGGISLLWPVSHHAFKLLHVGYVTAMALIIASVLARFIGGPRRAS